MFVHRRPFCRGAFGVVRLCQSTRSGELLALKQVRLAGGCGRAPGESKDLTTRPVCLEQALAEAEALSSAARHQEEWVVGLRVAFQDASSFYMVMDYVPGGDLVTHLQVLDTFNEVPAHILAVSAADPLKSKAKVELYPTAAPTSPATRAMLLNALEVTVHEKNVGPMVTKVRNARAHLQQHEKHLQDERTNLQRNERDHQGVLPVLQTLEVNRYARGLSALGVATEPWVFSAYSRFWVTSAGLGMIRGTGADVERGLGDDRKRLLRLGGELEVQVPAGPDVEGIRNLSRSLKVAAIAIDFHPRHSAKICDQGLSVFLGIFIAMHILGDAPSIVRQLIVALYRMPKEGRRTIGPCEAAFIWLHGVNDRPQNWGQSFKKLRNSSSPRWKHVYLKGAKLPQPCMAGKKVLAWGKLYSTDTLRVGGIDHEDPDIDGFYRSAGSAIHDVVQALHRDDGVPEGRVLIGGFSQGGAVALQTALTYPRCFAGCVSLSCWLTPHARSLLAVGAAAHCCPIFIGHGAADEIVGLDCASAAALALREAGARLQFETYEGGKHWPVTPELKDAGCACLAPRDAEEGGTVTTASLTIVRRGELVTRLQINVQARDPLAAITLGVPEAPSAPSRSGTPAHPHSLAGSPAQPGLCFSPARGVTRMQSAGSAQPSHAAGVVVKSSPTRSYSCATSPSGALLGPASSAAEGSGKARVLCRMASTCDERAGSSPAEDPAARILFGSLSASRVLAPMTGACVGSPQSAGRAAVRSGGPWCVERTVRLSPEDEQQDLVKRALRFDKSTVSSVGTAIGQLNRAAIQCDSGLCVVFSMSAQANFLLYRQDREQDVARAGMQAAGRTAAPPTVGAMTPAPPRPSCLGPDHPRPSLAGCGAVPVAASPQLPIRRLRFDSPDARPPNQLAQQPRSPKASTGEVTPRSVTLARVDESVSATPALPGSPARTKASCKLSTLSEEVTLTMSRLPLSKAALKHGDALETPQHGGFFTPRSLKHLPCSPTKDTAQRAMTLSPKATECYHEISASPIRASFAALSREEQPSKPEANDGKTFTIGGRQFGFLDVIGRGAFGVVWRAREQDASGEDVAVKVITCTDAAGFANATFEAELLQMLSAARSRMHSHIPRYVAHSAAKDADPSSGGVVRLAMSY
ncbi:unnamed protein product, partial [Prorocentrum cordatum]